MRQEHAIADARASNPPIRWTHLITWISAGIIVGTEVFGAVFAAAWAAGGLLEVGPAVQYALYTLALAASVAAMVPFMKRAASVDPLRGEAKEGQP